MPVVTKKDRLDAIKGRLGSSRDDVGEWLDSWKATAESASWVDCDDVKDTFPKADCDGEAVEFETPSGCRLVVDVDFIGDVAAVDRLICDGSVV